MTIQFTSKSARIGKIVLTLVPTLVPTLLVSLSSYSAVADAMKDCKI